MESKKTPDWLKDGKPIHDDRPHKHVGLPEGVKRSDEKKDNNLESRVKYLETELTKLKESFDLLLSKTTK